MPGKTDRILALLPATFRPLPAPSALYALLDAPGQELLRAENTLAAVMQAHWVNYADRGAPDVADLARMAALYGLAPRPDEGVEEFREHLIRYVRTFLDGTVTVQGVLRITAEALGLRIADSYADLDTWWTRPGRDLVTAVPVGEDAAAVVFGPPAAAYGSAAAAAAVAGSVDLSTGVDVRPAGILRLSADGAPEVTVDLAAAAVDPAHATGPEIVAAIAAAMGGSVVAELAAGRLRLASSVPGPGSRLAVAEGDGDAAPVVLGLRAHRYTGSDAAPARLTGTADLSGGVSLSPAARYLRIVIDSAVRELDLGTGQVSLDGLVDTINTAFGQPVASHDGHRLSLTSPAADALHRVELAAPGAQDAAPLLFADAPRLALGRDAQPARLLSTVDLTGGVDLRSGGTLALRLSGTDVTADVTGAAPEATTRAEIAEAINAAAGAAVAALEGTGIVVSSVAAGAGESAELLAAPTGDAGPAVFGIGPREFTGSGAGPAHLTGRVGLSACVDLAARHLLGLAVDGRPPLEVDLRATAADIRAVPLGQLVAAIDAAAPGVATHDGEHLVLTSPTSGPQSMVAVRAIHRRMRRAFVTRAMVTDEASAAVLGFVHKEATGQPATPARVAGMVDLSRGSDLSAAAYLRIGVDGTGFQDVRCAGPRPRATLDSDVVEAIDRVYPGLATSAAGRLVLTSPTAGPGSQIRFDIPRPGLDLLGLEPGESSGIDASTVRVAGTVDLRGGVDLPTGAMLRLAVDGTAAVDVSLAPGGPAHLSLDDLVIAINGTLVAPIATRDATRLIVRSRTAGAASRIEFATPVGVDATEALLGFAAPRVYQGTDATPARVTGTASLPGTRDIRPAPRLRLTVDAGPSLDVNLAASAADPAAVSLADIVAALNAAVPGVAAADGEHLVLTSPTTGSSSRIALAPSPADDARAAVLGNQPTSVAGTAATSASVTADVELTGTVDLSRRSLLRLQVGNAVTDIDVAGPVAAATSLDEVVAAVNAAVPGTASATADARLWLLAPPDARLLAVLPLRHLELEEYYRSGQSTAGPAIVRHGQTWQLVSDSVIPEPLRLRLRPQRGAAGPAVTGAGWEIRVLEVVPPGAELTLTADDETGAITAAVGAPGQPAAPLAHDKVLLRPLAGHDQDDPADALRLPLGRSTWRYLECATARFGYARFDHHDRFAGSPLRERAVFDVTRFGDEAGSPLRPEFDTAHPVPDLPVSVTSEWLPHRAGALSVNLPLDLDPRFGARFNEAWFGHPDGGAETFPAAVTEPVGDERYLVTLINSGFSGGAHAPPVPASALVSATLVARAPLGFTAQPMPFRIPARFSGGGPGAPARVYLADEGFAGQVLELTAKQPGAFGNDLEAAARFAGPGRFDVTVALRAARFESARKAVLGRPPAARTADLLTPGPVGVLFARGAGAAVQATREDTGTPP